MVAVIVRVVGVVCVVADQRREYAPFDAMMFGFGRAVARWRQLLAQIEREMDRHERVKRQRQNAGACRPTNAMPPRQTHPESLPAVAVDGRERLQGGQFNYMSVAPGGWSQARLDPDRRAVRGSTVVTRRRGGHAFRSQ